jgi:hypothetical protein
MSEEDNKQETTTEESTRPEHISEKFWNQDTGEVNVESLSTSYNALEKKLGQRTDELTKQIRTDMEQERNAKIPEKYEITMPEIPEDIDMEVHEDQPLLKWWGETAKSMGLSQEQFNEGINQFVQNEINGLPNIEEESKQLGDNSKDRIESANLWAKKHLSENAYNTMSKLSSTAEGVKALEEIMALNKSSVMPNSPTAVEAKPSLEDLRSMMKDPKYWKDGEKDPAYIERVSKLFGQL